MIAPVEQNRVGHHYGDDIALQSRPENESGKQPLQVARDAIGNHPVAAIAVAAVIGATAAWVIKRGIRS